MKRTHLSTGVYIQTVTMNRGRRRRERHTTLCGSVCDKTKTTTDPARVTCLNCQKKGVSA